MPGSLSRSADGLSGVDTGRAAQRGLDPLLTPHSAFYTPESTRDDRALSACTAARYLRDGRLENCVNRQFLVARS